MQINIVSILSYNEKYISRLKKLGEVKFFDTYLGDPEIPKKCKGAEILIITPRLHLDIMPYLGRCKLICLQATGYDCINLKAAQEKNITVCNVPDYCSQEVCEHIFALILACAKRIVEGDKLVKSRKWKQGISFDGIGLFGKTMGIFGVGNIGSKAARMARLFGMNVIANTAHPDPQREKELNLKFVDFEELLKNSDFLALCVPANEQTEGLFNKKAFSKMKNSAIFVNTSRGTLVNEEDLAEALNKGEIAYAGIDVFVKEPPEKNNPLLKVKNIILTPHSAWVTEKSLDNLWKGVCLNTEKFLQGKPQNVAGE